MSKLLRVSERHQITLPPSVMRDAGVSAGSYVAVRAENGTVILEPKSIAENALTREDWDAMDKLVSRQVKAGRCTDYAEPKAAKKHLK